MANSLYGKGREAFLVGASVAGTLIDWDTSDIKIALIDTGNYTVSIDVHQYMNTDTVPAAARVTNGISGNLASKTGTLGVADAADITLTAVSGATCEAIIIFKDGGGGGTSASGTTDLLIAYIDTATGLAVTPNGGDIEVQWDSGANKIFKL